MSIARALAAEPVFLICDEVTSALDQLAAEDMLPAQAAQDELNVAYLFITHDLGTVKRVANSVVVMLKGRLVAGGKTATMLPPLLHPCTELRLSSVPAMARRPSRAAPSNCSRRLRRCASGDLKNESGLQSEKRRR